ncbi:unnamed protein product [Laminaria digitata]
MKQPPCRRLWATVDTDKGERAPSSASRALRPCPWLVNTKNLPPLLPISPPLVLPLPPLLPLPLPLPDKCKGVWSGAASAAARRRPCCQSTTLRNASSSCPK